jgi:hypothetical protein
LCGQKSKDKLNEYWSNLELLKNRSSAGTGMEKDKLLCRENMFAVLAFKEEGGKEAADSSMLSGDDSQVID